MLMKIDMGFRNINIFLDLFVLINLREAINRTIFKNMMKYQLLGIFNGDYHH